MQNIELSKSKKIKIPISEGVKAAPFRPIYRIHRYLARRPHNLFEHLVKYYTKPGDLILDPFSGGGVTSVESILQGRSCVAYDINPLAIFVNKMELLDLSIDKIQKGYELLAKNISLEINNLYKIKCEECLITGPAEWFEWSYEASCNHCAKSFLISEASKPGIGAWACTHCKKTVKFSPNKSNPIRVIGALPSCDCFKKNNSCIHLPIKEAKRILNSIEKLDLAKLSKFIPKDKTPDNNMNRESALHKKGFFYFSDFFSKRNLYANGILKKAILETFKSDEEIKQFFMFIFSSSLRYTNTMVSRNVKWRNNRPLEWSQPGFWIPPVNLETNVWTEFKRRYDFSIKAKVDFNKELGGEKYTISSDCYSRGKINVAHASLFNSSSTKISLKDSSVDFVLTDPPYGNYLHYADISNFWVVWLREVLGTDGVIDNTLEAVPARKKGFPGAKTFKDYTVLMEKCFLECHRVLKSDGYMVLTFNNREPRAWLSLVDAIVGAGFDVVPGGVIFQDGIQGYKHTSQSRRIGSVVGDFVYTFKKSDKRKINKNLKALLADEESLILFIKETLLDSVEAYLESHKGAVDQSKMMTMVYLEFQPILFDLVKTARLLDLDSEVLYKIFDNIDIFDSHKSKVLKKELGSKKTQKGKS